MAPSVDTQRQSCERSYRMCDVHQVDIVYGVEDEAVVPAATIHERTHTHDADSKVICRPIVQCTKKQKVNKVVLWSE